MADLIGHQITNYEITGVLGKGGMAVVYRARQLNIQREVAIKVIKPDLADTEDLLKRFEREANTVASLSHPHILKLFDFGQYEGLLYLVMELLTGGALADEIRQGPLSVDRTARLVDQMAGALDYAHMQGLIHRDLKPQNILLDQRGNAHLTDFGIAKILGATTNLTQSGVVMGTPAYMSPEQWQGQALTPQADLYSFGVMVFEMLTGRLPFRADTPAAMMYRHLQELPPPIHTIREDLPPQLNDFFEQALAKASQQRFDSASALNAAFKAAIRPPVQAKATGVSTKPPQEDISEQPTIVGLETPIPPPPAATPRRSSRGLGIGVLAIGVVVVGLLLAFRAFGESTNLTGGSTATVAPTDKVALAATATSAPTNTVPPTTLVPTTLAPTVRPTNTATNIPPTDAPTVDLIAAAKSTNTAEAILASTQTALFRAGLTATAALWTDTPTNTATFTPTPIVPTATPSNAAASTPAFTPKPISTPAMPLWDDFSSEDVEASRWSTQGTRIVTAKVVDGALWLEALGNLSRWLKTTYRMRAVSALVTLQQTSSATQGSFVLQIEGSATYRIAITGCSIVTVTDLPSGTPVYSNKLPGGGCPTTHLLMITLDGKLAHFYLDGTEIASGGMSGDATGAMIGLLAGDGETSTVAIVKRVWVQVVK